MTSGSLQTRKKALTIRFLNRVLHCLARSLPLSSDVRVILHRLRGVKIGKGVFLGEDVFLESEYPECVEIGDRVQIAARTVIMAHLRGPGYVLIEPDAYIGPCCVIAAANARTIRIGEGSVIGALSAITTDVPARALVRPPPPVQVASVVTPLSLADSYSDFLRGLVPLKGKAPIFGSATGASGSRK